MDATGTLRRVAGAAAVSLRRVACARGRVTAPPVDAPRHGVRFRPEGRPPTSSPFALDVGHAALGAGETVCDQVAGRVGDLDPAGDDRGTPSGRRS